MPTAELQIIILQIVSLNFTFPRLNLYEILKLVPRFAVLNSYLFQSKAYV